MVGISEARKSGQNICILCKPGTHEMGLFSADFQWNLLKISENAFNGNILIP